jgi:hypothetical protein
LLVLAAGEPLADLRPAAGRPGRLNEQLAHVRVAGLGDRALPAALAGGTLRGDEPDEAHELLRTGKPAEVADLSDKPERGQRVNATQATQPANQWREGWVGAERVDFALERRRKGADLQGGLNPPGAIPPASSRRARTLKDRRFRADEDGTTAAAVPG